MGQIRRYSGGTIGFLEFLGYYRIKPDVHRIRYYWKKGKVEELLSYLENYFIKGSEFKEFNDFLNTLKEFMEKYNRRHHLGIKATPAVRFEEEKKYLGAFHRYYFVSTKKEWRKVNYDSLLSYGGNNYSVSFSYVSKHIRVRSYIGYKVQIFSQSEQLIKDHLISKNIGRENELQT